MTLPEPPDFDEMFEIANLIGQLQAEVSELDITIKEVESNTVSEVMKNTVYYVDGKRLPMNVVEVTYMFRGLNNELIPLRKQLGAKKARLEALKLAFETMQSQVKVYQTQSSNMRGALAV